MREYTGPTPDPAPRGWKEHDDKPPCPKCGEYLISPYTSTRTLGGKLKTFIHPARCRNDCDTSTV